MSLNRELLDAIEDACGVSLEGASSTNVGGGCINDARLLTATNGDRVFLKLNSERRFPGMFSAEAAGLEALDATKTIRVPAVLGHGEVSGQAFLLLEALSLQSRGDSEALGQQLAALHRAVAAPDGRSFGWERDNFIGSTPQPNPPGDSWAEFFIEHRLRFQFKLAARKGRRFESVDAFLEKTADLLSHNPQPSLLHGDLWAGNAAFSEAGEPVIFDPAVYRGDREAELAFTEMFGGFSPEFYHAYQEAWPLDPGYSVRKEIYNLYHVLNHFNIFGGGYAMQAQAIMDRFR